MGEFIDRFDFFASPNTGYGLDRRLMSAWACGQLSVCEASVDRVEKVIPGTKGVHAIATLLQPKRVSAIAARRAVIQLFALQPDGSRLWTLPYPGTPAASGTMATYSWTDSGALASRGDFPGFLAILALVRESFARTDYDHLERHVRDLYALLPSIAKLDWVRPDVDLLLQCIEDMMVGIRWIPVRVVIDWNAFREQMVIPQPWQGIPHWITSACSAKAGEESGLLLQRPVPLLDGTEPLWEYVRPNQIDAPQPSTEMVPLS